MTSETEWHEAEWDNRSLARWENGIEAGVDPTPGTADRPRMKWFWWVKPTSSRCEYPEMWNCGFASTVEVAKARADAAVRKADASYQHVRYV